MTLRVRDNNVRDGSKNGLKHKALSATIVDSAKKLNSKERSQFKIDEVNAASLEVDPALDFDFDKENATDLNAVSEFACDIFRYFKYREKFFGVRDYVKNNKFVDIKVRVTVVNWLVEVQEALELFHETLYTAVKLMDMYLSKVSVTERSTLQLIACAAVFIAAKIEERSPPLLKDLSNLCSRVFTEDQIKRMEREMLKVMGFDLCPPLSYSFLRRYGRVIGADLELLTIARYVLELSLHYLDFCRISESRIAAACMLLALRVTNIQDWSPVLVKYSGYALKDIEPLALHLNHLVHCFPKEHPRGSAVIDKYSHEIFFEVAKRDFLPNKMAKSFIALPAELLVDYQSFDNQKCAQCNNGKK